MCGPRWGGGGGELGNNLEVKNNIMVVLHVGDITLSIRYMYMTHPVRQHHILCKVILSLDTLQDWLINYRHLCPNHRELLEEC